MALKVFYLISYVKLTDKNEAKLDLLFCIQIRAACIAERVFIESYQISHKIETHSLIMKNVYLSIHGGNKV
jgi:hypothetical protein